MNKIQNVNPNEGNGTSGGRKGEMLPQDGIIVCTIKVCVCVCARYMDKQKERGGGEI